MYDKLLVSEKSGLCGAADTALAEVRTERLSCRDSAHKIRGLSIEGPMRPYISTFTVSLEGTIIAKTWPSVTLDAL